MRNLLFCIATAIVSTSLAAQTTGRIRGKVTDSGGKPVPRATLVLKRTDINQTREIRVDARGDFQQVGLEPREFEMVVSAEGYVDHKEIIKIPIGDAIQKDIILKTAAEAAAALGAGADNAGAGRANEGVGAYNEAVRLFNEKSYTEAISKLDSAIESFNESAGQVSDEAGRETIARNLTSANKLLAFSLLEAGKENSGQQREMWLKAEPLLKEGLEKAPNDASIAQGLAEIANMKGDAEAEKVYLDLVEKIQGPVAGNSYNRGVDLYNAGNLSEAKPHLKRAIEIDPKFSESYYLLGICEFSDGDVQAAKTNLQKYLELDPNGKNAAIVKEMLSDPVFK